MSEPSPAELFFDRVESAYERACAASDVNEKFFCIGGAVVCLRFAGSTLIAPLTRALAHLATTPVAQPALTIGLWEVAETGVSLPPPQWSNTAYSSRTEIIGFNNAHVNTSYQADSRALFMFHCDRALALYAIFDGRDLQQYDLAAPLRTIFHWWARTRTQTVLHAAAVGLESGGVLLAGRGGQGKSTSALACLSSELLYAGDDYCLLDVSAAPTVHSMYSTAKVHRETIQQLPFLTPFVSNPKLPENEKELLFLNEHIPQKMVRRLPVRAVLLPRVTGKRDSSLEPCTPAHALVRLAPSTTSQLPAAGSEVFEHLTRLLRQVPTFYLNAGTDLSQIPATILKLLEEMR